MLIFYLISAVAQSCKNTSLETELEDSLSCNWKVLGNNINNIQNEAKWKRVRCNFLEIQTLLIRIKQIFLFFRSFYWLIVSYLLCNDLQSKVVIKNCLKDILLENFPGNSILLKYFITSLLDTKYSFINNVHFKLWKLLTQNKFSPVLMI